MRRGIVLIAGCIAALTAASSSVRATPSACVIPAVSQMEYDSRAYRRVALTLPRGEPLATVQVWVQSYPCQDVVVYPSPQPPPPPPPLPPPHAVSLPLERLIGIAPQIAVGAADRAGSLWVRSSCQRRAAMDVAAGCLGLDDAAAYSAAKASGAPPLVTAPTGTFPLVVRKRITCPIASSTTPAPTCRTETGAIKTVPRVSVRRGERLYFGFEDHFSTLSISDGRTRPVEFTPESWRGWDVDATGRYTLRLVVRGANPAYRHETTYALPLRAR